MFFNSFRVPHRQCARMGFLLHTEPDLLVFLAFPNLGESLVSGTYHGANCHVVIAQKGEFL